MIYDYSIKRKNNEEILYLYLDFNNEFAKLNVKGKKVKLIDEINNFLKTYNVSFSGRKVALVAGGIIIGSLIIKNSTKIDDYVIPRSNSISIILNSENNDFKNETEEIVEDDEILKAEKEIKSVEETQSKKIREKKQGNSIKTTKDASNNNIENDNNIVEDNKNYVTIYRANGEVINIELEDYIVGVVAAEMPAEFNEEALMAQAIIARTYALKTIKNNKKLTDNSSTQNYKSVEELKTMWKESFDKYYSKVKDAVFKTSGKYLIYNGELIDAVYHSTSNGTTENSVNVWGNSFPYLVSVESLFDNTNPSFYKEELISYDILTNKFNMEINENTDFNILSKTSGNRVDKILINSKTYTGVEVRSLLGLRSADFEIEKNDTGIIFKTKGYGHGVGLSQYGANGMAKNGYNYEEILKHYYTGVTINN